MTKLVRLVSDDPTFTEQFFELHCGFTQTLIKPDHITVGAGGDTMRSIQPRSMMLFDVDQAEIKTLKQHSWLRAKWFDEQTQEDVEHAIHRIDISGKDLKIVF